MSNNQKGNENTELRIQALEDQIQRLMGIIESQQSEMLMSKRNNAIKTSTLDEEITIIFNMFAAIGFTIAIVLLAGVRERLEEAKIPSFMQGLPIVMISAALISIAFLGFQGLSF